MNDVQASDSPEPDASPGKIRTVWHPLLVRLLASMLAPAFRVEKEVAVGEPPLFVDIVLIRQEGGQLSESNTRDLAELLPLLNLFTLIEFKGPTDALQWGDFSRLLGCAFLWYSRLSERVGHEEISLIVIAPSVNGPLRYELRLLGCEISKRDEGIFFITGPLFTTWVVETDAMVERAQPILSLVSRAYVSDHKGIIERLKRAGRGTLAHFCYMVENVRQFRLEEDFAMQKMISENLQQFEEELFSRMLEEAPPERLLRVLAPEERLRGLAPEEILGALTPEKLARLRELLQERQEK